MGWDVETVPVTSGGHGGGRVPDALVRSSHEKLDLGQTGGPSTALGKRKQGERAQPCGCVAASRCWPRIRGLQRPREENPRTEHTLPEAQRAPCERRVSRHRAAGPSWGERSRLGRRAEPHCVQRGTRAGGWEAGCQGRDHQACTQAHGGTQHRKPAGLGRDHLCLWEGHTADSVDGGAPQRTRSPALVDGAQGACSPSTAGISNQRTCGHNTVVPRRESASKAPRPQAARVWGPPPTAGGKWQGGNLRGRRCGGQNRGQKSPAQRREVAGCTNQLKSCLSGKSVTSPENEDKAQQTRADSTGNRQTDSTVGSGTRRAVLTLRTGWPRRPGGTEAGCRAPRPA